MATKHLADELRSFLGDKWFYRFLNALERSLPRPRLFYWQDDVLDDFTARTGTNVPRAPNALFELLKDARRQPKTLSEADVPSWITIHQLEGEGPVQGYGLISTWSWYFRARWEAWTIAASVPGIDPVGVFENNDSAFFHAEDYGDARYAASYMPLDEARFFIVRELSRLRAERKL